MVGSEGAQMKTRRRWFLVPLLAAVLAGLWLAYGALARARERARRETISAKQAVPSQLPELMALDPCRRRLPLFLKHLRRQLMALLVGRGQLLALELREDLIHLLPIEARERLFQAREALQLFEQYAQLWQIPVICDLVQGKIEGLGLLFGDVHVDDCVPVKGP